MTPLGTESSLMAIMVVWQTGQLIVVARGKMFLGVIESRFRAVVSGIKLARSGGRKWPPQLKHS